jgi:hypothetical protein
MGIPVLVLGESGAGKTASLRNFAPDEIGIFSVTGKPLPFPTKLPKVDNAKYQQITASLQANKLKAYAIDDSQYLLVFDEFERAQVTGFSKFTEMAQSFYRLIRAAANTSNDTCVYFLHHIDHDEGGHIKAKTVGKMLDNKLVVEGLFPVVLLADVVDGKHIFHVHTEGSSTVKTPMGMYETDTIDNDLKAVDTTIRKYWGLASLKNDTGKKE